MNNHEILRKFKIFYVYYGFGLLDYGFWIDDEEEDKWVNQFWIMILNMIISEQRCCEHELMSSVGEDEGIRGIEEDEGRNIIVVIWSLAYVDIQWLNLLPTWKANTTAEVASITDTSASLTPS